MRFPPLVVQALISLMIITISPHSSAHAASRYDRLLSDPGGRSKLERLAGMEEARVVAGIEPYLADGEPLIRLRCAEVLGRVGEGERVIGHLARLAGDSDGEVARTAVYGLGLTGDPAALDHLEAAVRSGSKEMRLIALEALGISRVREASEIIAPWLTNFNSSVRAAAATALAVLGDSSAAVECVNRIFDPDPAVLSRVVYALGRLGYAGENGRMIKLLEHEDESVVLRSAEALGRLRAEGAVEPLAALLSRSEGMTAVKAAEALARIGSGDAARALEPFLSSQDPYIRALALDGIAASRKGNMYDKVLPLLQDPSHMVRRSAIAAAAATGGGKSRPYILAVVRSGQPRDRAAALETLGGIGARDDLLLLAETLRLSASHLDREGAAAGLRAYPDKEHLLAPLDGAGLSAADALLDAAAGDDRVVAAMSIEALGECCPHRFVDELAAVFREHRSRQDADRRLAVMAALAGHPEEVAKTGGRSAVLALLREAASDPDPRVREAAAGAALAFGETIEPGAEAAPRWDRGVYPWGEPALPMGTRRVVLRTASGEVEIELFGDEAPNVVRSILLLAGEGFYNGLSFHRVVPGFVVQGGCPRGDGWGDAGYFLRSQFNTREYWRGTVGMAHSGKDTAGSQFFITQIPQPHLDGRYTIVGRVVDGMEIVDGIEVGDTFGITVAE